MPPSASEILAECAANPDDDAPRLVWADLVGGERGELVVIQCDLARGGLTAAEARVRRQRERELLDRHAIAWAGDLASVARRWSFRRGFVEAARFSMWRSPVAWPLLRSMTIDHGGPGTWEGIEQLRALGVTLAPERAPPAFAHLRALAVHRIEDRHVDSVIEVLTMAPIETLRVRIPMTGAAEIRRVLDAADRVTALELPAREDLALPVNRPLRALRIGRVMIRWLVELEGSAAAATLERFGFDLQGDPVDLTDILASMRRLHTVEIGGNVEAAAQAIVDAGLPALRVLRIRGEVSPRVLRAIDERYDLELLDVTTRSDELVHESQMLALGPPWLVWSDPAVLARIDQPEIFDVPAFDASDHITIGRGADVPLRLLSGTVARHHARLYWRDGGHEIQDLASTNGTIIAGSRIERVPLLDGDEMILGNVRLRYFIGPGARDRAVSAISGFGNVILPK
ncbi:MAG: FHA domain-containing protein [Myxococcota bacterium]|nr:FHA domain-containing protein [Myxococcota bacterium]